MNNQKLLRILFVLAIVLVTACNSFTPFTFVQMSDTQIGFNDDSPFYEHSDSLMKAAVHSSGSIPTVSRMAWQTSRPNNRRG